MMLEDLNIDKISTHQACGAYPIKGILLYAKNNNLKCKTLCLANSGDTAGNKREVVGYGAYAFIK